MPIAIISGGSFRQFETQFLTGFPKDVSFENFSLYPTSAAQCYVYKNGAWQTLYAHLFTPEEKQTIIQVLEEGIKHTRIIDSSTPQFGDRIEDRGAQISFSALGQSAPIALKRLWDPTREKRAPLQKFLIDALPGCSVRANASNTIDITRAGITKAYGVQEFSRMVDVPVSAMLYVGDALFEGGERCNRQRDRNTH